MFGVIHLWNRFSIQNHKLRRNLKKEKRDSWSLLLPIVFALMK